MAERNEPLKVKESMFETVATPLRTASGAEVRRTRVEDKPDTLELITKHLQAKQKDFLTKEKETRKPGALPDPMVPALESMTVHYEKDPSQRIRVGVAVNTYVLISMIRDAPVVRYYIHTPKDFRAAFEHILKDSGESIMVSEDSFIRPSAI